MNQFRIGPRLATAFAGVIAILVVVSVMAYSNFGRTVAATEDNTRTFQAMLAGEEMLVDLLNIETGERGYLASGDAAFLEPYQAGRDGFRGYLADARDLTEDQLEQQERLDEIERLYETWIYEHIEPGIDRRPYQST